MADKVQRRAVVGVLRQLGRHLLHPVLAQGVDARPDSLLTGRRVVHLAGAHQRDVRAGAPRLPGRLVDLAADRRNIFRNRHEKLLLACISVRMYVRYRMTLPSYSVPAEAMTSSPVRSVRVSEAPSAGRTSA